MPRPKKGAQVLPLSTDHSARNISSTLEVLPIANVRASEINPRKHFDEAALDELAASITTYGLQQPIGVRVTGVRREQGEAGPVHRKLYEIVWGERRWRAAQRAGQTEIEAKVFAELTDLQALELALLENLARRDIDPIEEAMGYAELRRLGVKQAEIAERMNRSQPAIANAMRLLELPDDVQQRIRAGELSVSHGVALCRFKEWPAIASAVAELAVARSLTSKSLEKGLPDGWALKQKGLVGSLWTNEEIDACRESCPFGAFLADGNYQAWCLKPDHLEELREARRANAAAERSEEDREEIARQLEERQAQWDRERKEREARRDQLNARVREVVTPTWVTIGSRELVALIEYDLADMMTSEAFIETVREARIAGEIDEMPVRIASWLNDDEKGGDDEPTDNELRDWLASFPLPVLAAALLRMQLTSAYAPSEVSEWYLGIDASADEPTTEIRKAATTDAPGITREEIEAIEQLDQEHLQEAA